MRYLVKHQNKIFFALLLLLPVLAYIRFPLSGSLIVDFGDGLTYLSSMRFYLNSIADGEFAVWNKYLCGGSPAAVSAYIYPVNLLLGFLPSEWFIFVYYCLHIGIGSIFMFLYLGQLKCDLLSRVAVAVIYLFSIHIGGVRKSHMMIIQAIVMLPIAMYLIQKHINSGKLIHLVLAAVPLTAGFLGGHPQTAVYVAAAASAYYVIIAMCNKTKPSVTAVRLCVLTLTALGFAAVWLFPAAQVIRTYAQHGSSQTDYATFASYSIHPIKLIQMLFPRFFGENNIFQFGTPLISSEMDIEIYIGIAALFTIVLIFLCVKDIFKNVYIKTALAFCALSFGYAAIAHIPVLRQIVYRTPILGTFRVASRVLPVFIFFLYAILAMCLTKLFESGFPANLLRVAYGLVAVFAAVCASLLWALSVIARLIDAGEYTVQIALFNWANQAIAPNVILLAGYTLLIHVLVKFRRKWRAALILLLLTLTLWETLPFSLMTAAPDKTALSLNTERLSYKLSNEIGNYKVFDAFAGIDGGHQSAVSQNRGVLLKVPAINAYITYNNPVLYRMLSGQKEAPFNFSGLLTGSLNAGKNVMVQNDLLSMLGVKYIIDSSNFIPDGGFTGLRKGPLVYESGSEVTLPDSAGTYSVLAEQVRIEPYKQYYISLDYETDASSGYVYADFYGGERYDLDICQQTLSISESRFSAQALLQSADTSLADGDIFLRLISVDMDYPLNIKKMELHEAIPQDGTMIYEPYYFDETNRVFINNNARDILYFADEVKGIDDSEYVIANREQGLNLDKVNYIVGAADKNYETANRLIKDIDFRNNVIQATVECDNEQFINFSQCYFPGWRAYIDGKRTDLKVVNALIMGIEVPSGTHNVTFRFISAGFIAGSAVTGLTILFWVLYFLARSKKDL